MKGFMNQEPAGPGTSQELPTRNLQDTRERPVLMLDLECLVEHLTGQNRVFQTARVIWSGLLGRNQLHEQLVPKSVALMTSTKNR